MAASYPQKHPKKRHRAQDTSLDPAGDHHPRLGVLLRPVGKSPEKLLALKGAQDQRSSGGECLMGTELQSGEMKKCRRWMVVMASPQCKHTQCHCTVCLKIVKMINLMFVYFAILKT